MVRLKLRRVTRRNEMVKKQNPLNNNNDSYEKDKRVNNFLHLTARPYKRPRGLGYYTMLCIHLIRPNNTRVIIIIMASVRHVFRRANEINTSIAVGMIAQIISLPPPRFDIIRVL